MLSLGDIVYANSIRVGGDKMDEALIAYLRRKHNLAIGESTAERVKKVLGTAKSPEEQYGDTLTIRGLDLTKGIPREFSMSQAQVADALIGPLNEIRDAVMLALEQTPPDLAADIADSGVILTGGGALLGDLDVVLREQTGLTVTIAEEPLKCVAIGTGKSLDISKHLRHAIDYHS